MTFLEIDQFIFDQINQTSQKSGKSVMNADLDREVTREQELNDFRVTEQDI